MSALFRTRSGYQRLQDDENIEQGVPAPFPIHELYPAFYPSTASRTIAPLASRTFTPHAPTTPPPPSVQAVQASSSTTIRPYTVYMPSPLPQAASHETIESFEQKSGTHTLIPTNYLDSRAAAAHQKIERNLNHEKFMVKVLHAVDKYESLDFAKGLQFESDIPAPSVNLVWLALATIRADAIDLLCRLHSPDIANLAEFVFKQILFDISRGLNKKLDQYPQFLLEITRQNPDKIPPEFLLKYYLCSKEKDFKQRFVHKHILDSLIQAYGFTPETILSTLDQKQLNQVNSAAAHLMGIKSEHIVEAKKRLGAARVGYYRTT